MAQQPDDLKMKFVLSIFLLFCLNCSIAQKSDTLSVFFPFDSDIPLNNEHNNRVFLRINELNSQTVYEVIGYTDTIGKNDYNKQLAQRRIDRVLEKLGDSLRYTTKIIGETDSYSLLSNNRRVVVKPVGGDTLVLKIQFRNRTADILQESFQTLIDLFNLLDESEFSTIELHGHVCCTNNYPLSLERAEALQRELISHGIDPEKIKCFGHGNTQPRYPEPSAVNEAKNRRVEVVLLN